MSKLFRITRNDADDSATPSLYQSINGYPNLAYVDGALLSAREGDYVREAIDYLDATPNAVSASYPGLVVTRA